MLYAFVRHLITVHKNGDIIARNYDNINVPKHYLHIYARTTNFVQGHANGTMYNYDAYRGEFEIWDHCIKIDPIPLSYYLPKEYEWLMTSTTPFYLQRDQIILYARSFVWIFDHKRLIGKYPIVQSAAIPTNPDLEFIIDISPFGAIIYQVGGTVSTWIPHNRTSDTYIYPPHYTIIAGGVNPEHGFYNKLTNRLNVRINLKWYSIPVWPYYQCGRMGAFVFNDDTNEVLQIDTETSELCDEPRHVAKITIPL